MQSQKTPAWLCRSAALALALVAVTVLWLYLVPVPAGQDQSCYFAMARLLEETGTTRYAAFIDGETTGSFWVNDGHDAIWPVYAPGYPLLLAAARRLGGPGAEYWVTPIAFFLLLLAVFALARRFLPAWWALLATFLFAVSPALFLNAQLQNTHVVGCLLTVAALVLATARGGRPRPLAAAFCG
ncbi:MAG: hypothetical protein J6333_05895, partial [Planctomycetes bacterium]|nr:hypothetical protein [Planctomycetota bacterium]